ncbi:MAG: AAA family ATPase, partial [Alphaproteobacteria bacterium]|nr:AAA family ATPase [Alphaproteobacteria bacterium]
KTHFDDLVIESRFIDTQRLQLNYAGFDNPWTVSYEKNYLSRVKQRRAEDIFHVDYGAPSSKSRIQEYASDLSRIIRSKRSNYFEESQDVEKQTLSEYLSKSNINLMDRIRGSEIEDIKDDISKMKEHMANLLDLGIYKHGEMSHIRESETLNSSLEHLKNLAEKTPDGDLMSQDDINKFLDGSLKSLLLKSYAENMRKKLDIFEDLEGKIEIFTKHINNLFKYKEMKVDLEKGFVFRLNDGLEKGRIINPIDLSSGEQHEVILNYELIFKTDDYSVILVDEPEISIHMLWQRRFIDNLLDIAKKNSLNIIVATHSPDIVNKHRNLVCALSEI